MRVKKEEIAYLRRDFPQLLWGGVLLQPEADMAFWLEKLEGTLRIIHASLVKPGEVLELIPQRDFDLENLGHDYVNLDGLGSEMIVVGRHFTNIMAQAQEATVKLSVKLLDEQLVFQAATGIMGRWDWFINPQEMRSDTPPLSAMQPVAMMSRMAA